MNVFFQRLSIVFSLFFIQGIAAQNIIIDDATQACSNFIFKNGESDLTISNTPDIIWSEQHPLAYIFNFHPQGYVVVSANASLPPVIAYSFESNFGKLNPDNPLYSILLADLKNRLIYAKTENENYANKNRQLWETVSSETFQLGSRAQWPSIGDGWITTNWTQYAPYSNFCPMDATSGQRSIAGCPAVAMAQILNFHKTTNGTSFDDGDDYYHNYLGRQFYVDDDGVTLDFPSFPLLNKHMDTLNAHWQNNVLPDNTDKAALTFACGVACKQVYTSSSSGTFGVNQAFNAYLKFGFTSAELLHTTDSSLYPRLIQNIKDTLPAHLAVVNAAWTSGHNVIVDGYNTDNYFHINFGWGGSYNGWYLLPQEIPYNLTVIEGLIIDIIPDICTGTEEITNQPTDIQIFPNPATDYIYVFNMSSDDLKFDIYSSDGKLVLSESGSHADISTLKNGNYIVIARNTIEILGKSKITIIR